MSDNGLHKIPAMRSALEVIQELHCENVRSSMLSLCYGCLEVWPCDTRRIADQGLGDNLARTTKNGGAS